MKYKLTRVSIVTIGLTAVSSNVYGMQDEAVQRLKSNYQVMNNQTQKAVDNFSNMFKEGSFYGRLRSNTFLFKWDKENAKQKNSLSSGLGGSLIYQSAIYNNFDFKVGLYYSHGFTNLSSDNAKFMKAGSDVLSRFNYSNTGSQDLGVLGQAYSRYSGIKNSEIKVGRQLVETFYTKSNDTKMIPNTFDAVVFDTKILPNTSITLGYLAKEKLRGHSDTHSVLVYGDSSSSSSTNPAWDENDDTAMHKGLTYSKLKEAGKSTDAPLIVLDLHNSTIENLKVDAAYYNVPELLSEAMIELNYKIGVNQDISITPGVRYIRQFDHGAGAVGGAAYDGTPLGYKDQDSLDSQMFAARLVTQYKKFKLNLGYSKVFDEADLITPWRGFPTAGYTRSMARYNWMANTKSYRVELQVNANKTGIYKDLFVQTSFLHTDADEKKGQYDENYYYLGFVQNLSFMEELQWRFRIGYADTKKRDADSIDTRFELNYLF